MIDVCETMSQAYTETKYRMTLNQGSADFNNWCREIFSSDIIMQLAPTNHTHAVKLSESSNVSQQEFMSRR